MNKSLKKKFDCLEYKYKVQEDIYKKIRNLSKEDEIEYFKRKAHEGSFKDLVPKVQSKTIQVSFQ
jgi:hypothetical protein